MGNCFGKKRVKAVANSSGQEPFDRDHPSSGSFSKRQTIADLQDGSLHHVDHTPGRVATLRQFPFAHLKRATRNFHADLYIDEGGCGCLFKGYVVDDQTFLPDRTGHGMAIVVKKLNLKGLHGRKQWLAEVQVLGALHHPNLVKLIGYCAEQNHRLLVYEFMPRGSLEIHLFQKGNSHQTLSWATRMKIATGAARGLAFLHNAQRPVIYRNLRPSNILLDTEYNAKLSDFGNAKDGPTGDDTYVSTRALGADGYVAPEYTATGHLTPKSDVYSFGMVLLEILTGRRAVDKTLPKAEQKLLDWAGPLLTDRHTALGMMDPMLAGRYPPKGALKALQLAVRCLNQEWRARPNMGEVLEKLEQLVDSDQEAQSSGQDQELGGIVPPPSPRKR